ncbi:MAG: helix-turn-helix domain-containing protein, partial [Verrucomicrobiota bacterium]
PLLVSHFLKNKVHAKTGKPFQMTRQAVEVLCAHDWPGNVRELENAIERACALCEDPVIQVSDLPPTLHRYVNKLTDDTVLETREGGAPPNSLVVLSDSLFPLSHAEAQTVRVGGSENAESQPVSSLKSFLRDQELAYLNRALAQTGGDKEKAAEMLGISLATLYRKLSEDADA